MTSLVCLNILLKKKMIYLFCIIKLESLIWYVWLKKNDNLDWFNFVCWNFI